MIFGILKNEHVNAYTSREKKNMDQTLWANEEQPQSVYHDAFKITWL